MKMNKTMKASMSLAATIATVAIAGSAHAAIVVTGGDFESPDISGNAQITDIPMWFNNTKLYSNWHNGENYTSNGTQSALIRNQGSGSTDIGYMYQSLGTLGAGTSLDWSFDHVSYFIGTNHQGHGTAEVRFFHGTGAGAGEGTDIDTLALTQIGSTVSISAPSNTTSQLRSGSVDVSALSAGSTIWMDFTQTSGNFVIDNVAVTSVPEPSTTALLGLGGLALILRRRR